MDIKQKKIPTYGIRFHIEREGKEVAYAYLYLIYNAHKRPFGLVESIFVDEEFQRQGIGTKLINTIIAEAKKLNCYKLFATSRFEREKVHEWYIRIGFKEWDKGFRMNFDRN